MTCTHCGGTVRPINVVQPPTKGLGLPTRKCDGCNRETYSDEVCRAGVVDACRTLGRLYGPDVPMGDLTVESLARKTKIPAWAVSLFLDGWMVPTAEQEAKYRSALKLSRP